MNPTSKPIVLVMLVEGRDTETWHQDNFWWNDFTTELNVKKVISAYGVMRHM
jgi:hypothetical protein